MSKSKRDPFERVESTAANLTAQQQETRDRNAQHDGEDALLPLAGVKSRAQNTRPLNAAHLVSLAESIAALGLIEPLTVDSHAKLLAGGHRFAALQLLRETDNAKRETKFREFIGGEVKISPAIIERVHALYTNEQGEPFNPFEQHFPGGMVPVHRMPFDSDQDAARALAVEIAENEKRKDYTPAEVRGFYDRLRDLGYTDREGRPRTGDRSARALLATVIGKSRRTVARLLEDEDAEDGGNGESDNRSNTRQNAEYWNKRLATAVERWRRAIEDAHAETPIQGITRLRQLAGEIAGLLNASASE